MNIVIVNCNLTQCYIIIWIFITVVMPTMKACLNGHWLKPGWKSQVCSDNLCQCTCFDAIFSDMHEGSMVSFVICDRWWHLNTIEAEPLLKWWWHCADYACILVRVIWKLKNRHKNGDELPCNRPGPSSHSSSQYRVEMPGPTTFATLQAARSWYRLMPSCSKTNGPG